MVGKPERKRPLGRPRTAWEDNTGRSHISCTKCSKYFLSTDIHGYSLWFPGVTRQISIYNRFRPKSHESCSQSLLLAVPVVLPNLQEEVGRYFVFNLSPPKRPGVSIRRSWCPSYRPTTSKPSHNRATEVGNNVAMEVRRCPIFLTNGICVHILL